MLSDPEGPGRAVRLSIPSLILRVLKDMRAFVHVGDLKLKEREESQGLPGIKVMIPSEC